MATLPFFLLPFLLFSLSLPSSPSSDLFEAWCRRYGKIYSSSSERQYRLKVFEDNLAFITHHNQMSNSSFTLDLNAFADLTHHEFRASKLRLGLPSANFNKRRSVNPRVLDAPVPDSVDWRKNGAVTKVKDQGTCGACWAFSATGAIEGINKIFTGSLVSLSEQELIDCDTTYNNGCNGGLMDYAYQFVVDNHGIDTEEDYPYRGKQPSCNKVKIKRRIVTIDGYADVPEGDEAELLRAVAAQPVSVGICASDRVFQHYSKGILSGPCSNVLDHAVLIVGYGSEGSVDYWIVKNSWGTRWGMNGYVYMQRNTGDSKGLCGINSLASYPIKTSANPPAPPPPSPGPTWCDLFNSCPEGSTCCCSWSVLGICLRWRCCQLNSAVCCKDGVHCCPREYPVCDTSGLQCLKGNGNFTSITGLQQRQDAHRRFGAWNALMDF